ncbi:SDR family NAD(P)-dependent oxidoreductase [Planctobacterium marinum]|uniref:Short-chain dehydrogenase n=1 Tax=Planctobacterium marinum TaxID=1631968 RepID=A0AA48I0U6_9ALTE|nr:short-chain dehydrogenase [Planctobacterium marinum]
MESPLKVKHVLLIGASGGIAEACLAQLESSPDITQITAVSRQPEPAHLTKTDWISLPQQNEQSIAQCCATFPAQHYDLVISTIGVLHDEANSITPEKKLEDIGENALSEYFRINSILPALWLKGLVTKINPEHSNIVFFSARVGSISDNGLGGWYGYRASKSALNMLLKTAQIEYQRRAKGCNFIAYHPGTVDTRLSEPFQRNVKPEKLFTPEFTVERLFAILSSPPDSPPPWYLDWQNKPIPW